LDWTNDPGDTLEVFTSAANKGITIKSGTGSSFENPTLTFIDVGNSTSTLAVKSDAFAFSTYGVTNALTITGSNGALTTNPAAGGHAVFNEAGNDVDFRVESNNNANMLFVDGGNDKIGIGTTSPVSELHIDSATTSTTLTIESDVSPSLMTSGIDLIRSGVAKGSRIESLRDASAGGVGLKFLTTANNAAEVNGTLTSRMVILETGEVGIGTDSPSTSLHASMGSNGSGLIDVARFENEGTTVNDGARIQLTAGASTSGAGIGCLGDALNSAHLVLHAGGNNERMRITSDGGLQFPTNNTFIATANGSSAFEWGAFRRPASSDGGQLTVRQYSSGDTAANYPAYASSNGSGTWDENTGVYFPELDQVGLTANGNPTLTIEDGRKIELYENGFTSGDSNRGQRVCLGGISHIANTNPGGTGSGTYLHIKTNLPHSNIMFRFEYKGISYDSQNMDTSIIGYTYAGVSYVHSPQIQDTGNTTYNFKTPYYSSDSKLVLVLQIANNYTGGILWAQFVGSHAMSPGTIAIASCIYSNSTSGAF